MFLTALYHCPGRAASTIGPDSRPEPLIALARTVDDPARSWDLLPLWQQKYTITTDLV